MELSSFRSLTVEWARTGVLAVMFDAPRRANALDAAAHRELTELWPQADSDDRVRSVLLKGAGSNFCAGGDLDWVQGFVDDEGARLAGLREARQLVVNMLSFSKPVVSAVRGHAVGAGLVAALLADVSIVADNATLMDGHTRIGVAAGDHAALLWPLLCGMAKAKYYLLTNEPLSGADAERIGLVSKVVPDDEVIDAGLRMAERLAAGPPRALSWTKQALNSWLVSASPILDAAIALEFMGFASREGAEGVTAAREKRRPQFD